MSKAKATHITFTQALRSGVNDYLMLIKVGLTTMVVFTAVASFMIASGLEANWIQMLLLGFGGFCITGASNALNQVLEKDFDKLMKRTMDRPVAAGRMLTSTAVMSAGMMCMAGVTALAVFNVWAAFLGMLAFVTYAFIYTPLKRYSSAAVFVGAIAGAMPMMIGVVAWTGEITPLAVSLFLIQFAWQYPHFWAIGYLGFDDYSKAGFKFVPTANGQIDRGIATSAIGYSILLIVVTIAMAYTGLISWIAGGALFLLGAQYLRQAVIFKKKFTLASAKKLMFSSLIYIPLAMVVLIIDKL